MGGREFVVRVTSFPRAGFTPNLPRNRTPEKTGVFFATCASRSSRHDYWLRDSSIRATMCWSVGCEPAGLKCRLAGVALVGVARLTLSAVPAVRTKPGLVRPAAEAGSWHRSVRQMPRLQSAPFALPTANK